MDILTAQMQFAVEYKFTENISIETRAGSTHSSEIRNVHDTHLYQ